jgi:hypothetical protein
MRVVNSMVAVLAGYVAAVVVFLGWFLVVGGEFDRSDVYAFLMIVAVVALYAFPCALLFVLPVWFFLPSRSRYWRTSWATAIGAFVAAIVMIAILVSLGLFDAERGLAGMILTWATGVVVGAVTGFVCGVLHRVQQAHELARSAE